MDATAPSSRELLERMLAKVDEMRHALRDASGVSGAASDDDADLARAMAALEDLERRVRRMLEAEDRRP